MAREPSLKLGKALFQSDSTLFAEYHICPLVCAEEALLRGRASIEKAMATSRLAARAAYVKFRGPTEGHKGLL